MQKQVTIIAIVVVALVFIGTTLGVVLAVNSSYKKQADDMTANISTAQTELEALKSAKDTNGFTPTEVVKSFFNEVKSGSLDKAKLYLSPDVQNMDIAASLKLGNDTANINTGDSSEETSGEEYLVNMTFIFETEETTVRYFNLAKYDDAWKITGVIAE